MFNFVTVEQALETHRLDLLVVVEESPQFPGELVFQVDDPQSFYERYSTWVSRYLCLSQPFVIEEFVALLTADGWNVCFTESTADILEAHHRHRLPLTIENFTCPGGGELYPFQTYTLRRALERSTAPLPQDRFFFIGWSTGTGKSVAACAGAQELFNRGQIDHVICATTMSMKPNLAFNSSASFAKTTSLDVTVNDGTKAKRVKGYQERHQVYVINYEKCWVDYRQLLDLVLNRKVLFVLDEAQKCLSAEPTRYSRTKTRKHLDKLVAACQATVWPMSASVVDHSPLRYRDVFNLSGDEESNPLGSARSFISRYATSVRNVPMNGTTVSYYSWSNARLQEVRHRVAARTQSIRKTDPGVRDSFKSNQMIMVPIEMSREDRRLYDMVVDDARRAKRAGEPLVSHYRLLRYICNTPLALKHTSDALGASLAREYPRLVTNTHNAKLAVFQDHLESISSQNDKVVAFTKWTNLGLLLISPELKGVNHVLHYGVGQSAADSALAQQRFKTDPEVTLFFSSDAGAHGLNLPEARYNISYEVPFSFDLLMQRSERNNRADSQFDTTTYAYVTEDTVEERIWEINDGRRRLSESTQGTRETLNYGEQHIDQSEEAAREWLIFG